MILRNTPQLITLHKSNKLSSWRLLVPKGDKLILIDPFLPDTDYKEVSTSEVMDLESKTYGNVHVRKPLTFDLCPLTNFIEDDNLYVMELRLPRCKLISKINQEVSSEVVTCVLGHWSDTRLCATDIHRGNTYEVDDIHIDVMCAKTYKPQTAARLDDWIFSPIDAY